MNTITPTYTEILTDPAKAVGGWFKKTFTWSNIKKVAKKCGNGAAYSVLGLGVTDVAYTSAKRLGSAASLGYVARHAARYGVTITASGGWAVVGSAAAGCIVGILF